MEEKINEEYKSKNTVHLIGQSHIDLSWLWPRMETINEVLPNTYKNALQLMEKYPEFRYIFRVTSGCRRWKDLV